MSGHYNGVRAFIQEEIPQTVYTHCHAHALNLVISDASKCCIQVQDLFSLLKLTTAFISRSYKRTNLWKWLLSTKIGPERLRKLQKVGDTRWNSKDYKQYSMVFMKITIKETDLPYFLKFYTHWVMILQLTVILDRKPEIC
jgi:hypothetical protein